MNQPLFRRAVAEGLGTFAFTFVGAATICADAYSGGEAGLVGIALAHGLILAAVVAALGRVSGAHVNPAVTVAALLSRAVAPVTAVVYVVVQLVGASLAGFMLTATFGADVWEPVRLGAPGLGPGVAAGTGIFIEAVLTFFLALVVLQASADEEAPGSLGALAIGATMTAGMLVGGTLTGGAQNPARAFGPALASGLWEHQYVYWIGPLLGGIVAAVAAGLLRPTPPPGEAVGGEAPQGDGERGELGGPE